MCVGVYFGGGCMWCGVIDGCVGGEEKGAVRGVDNFGVFILGFFV